MSKRRCPRCSRCGKELLLGPCRKCEEAIIAAWQTAARRAREAKRKRERVTELGEGDDGIYKTEAAAAGVSGSLRKRAKGAK